VKVKLGPLDSKWSFSLSVGLIQITSLEQFTFPASAVELRKSSWIIYGDSVLENGIKVRLYINCIWLYLTHEFGSTER